MEGHTIIGTVGGTVLALCTVTATSAVNAIVIAGIGAVTSFFVSLLLKRICIWISKK